MSNSFCHFLPHAQHVTSIEKPSNQVHNRLNPFISLLSPTRHRRKREPEKRKVTISEKISFKNHSLFQIDEKIKELLSSRISTIPTLIESLNTVLWIATNSDDISEQIRAEHEAELLRTHIKDLENSFQMAYYMLQTQDILDEYRSLQQDSKPVSFVSFQERVNPNQARLNILEEKFMAIALEYIEIEDYERKTKKLRCPQCDLTSFKVSLIDDSIYICKECDIELEMIDDSPSFKDTDRVNMSAKYTYTREGHFRDAMKKFQGIQSVDPKKIKVIKDILLEEMRLHNLTSERGLSNSVTKDHIYDFLTNKKLNKYYEDVNLLYNMITGEPCPNIQHLQEALLEDFALQEEGYEKVRDLDRVNSLNVYYKLYKLLQKHHFPCKKSDFYILKTKAKEQEHDEITKKVWTEHLGWTWIPT